MAGITSRIAPCGFVFLSFIPHLSVSCYNKSVDDTQDISKSGKSNLYWSFLLVLILGIVIGMLIHRKWIADNTVIKKTTEYVSHLNSRWQKMSSRKTGFPVVNRNTGVLSVYDIEGKTIRSTGTKVEWGKEEIATGTSSPLPSPDYLFTAFIDAEDKRLWILSNETLEKQAVTNGPVDFITAWSPSGRKILFSVREDTVETRLTGESGFDTATGSATLESFDRLRAPGFYIFNVESGAVSSALPFKEAESFVSDETVFFTTSTETGNSVAMNDFNLQKFAVSYGRTTSLQRQTGQYNFSRDGRFWTFISSQGIGKNTTIMYAPYPSLEGTEIDSGRWAEAQWPKISPNGTKLAFLKQENITATGTPDYFVNLHDLGTGATSPLVPARNYWWLDDSRMIVENSSGEPGIGNPSFSVLNIFTRQLTKIPDAPAQ